MKSPITWLGGKSRMVKKLIELIPEHICYTEVFGGAGWLLFGKKPSKVEILNDLDSNLMNLWNSIKYKPEKLIKSFDYTLISRETFEEYKKKYKQNNYNDDIEKAHIFYYLVKAGFGGEMVTQSFGTRKTRPNSLRLDKVDEVFMGAHKRLQKVTIENKSFEEIFKIYDKNTTFFFLDPPYRNTSGYPVGKFTDDKYKLLSECCKKCKGKFLLTINDDEYIRELFKGFNFIEHKVLYTINNNTSKPKKFDELIITNYNNEL
ncbi:DNA adenine methylase [Gottschalkia purinilytica]|uniref:site-specific DNA-methyltransferase (adenine-specific) n=1 Tax=Gottschalkia purinilytica TaxID=1503 RepID=A0A0L0WAP6_GOTPU|nr:DNA adenine methylase [Gottschalkia purinilytica]KNF08571.1 DNA adenine methylase [Gottschalkia purinilytica]